VFLKPNLNWRKPWLPKEETAFDMSNAVGDLTKMIESFKLPGVDTKDIVEARRKDIDALVQANQAIFDGMQALANKQGELLKTAMEDIQAAVKSAPGGAGVGDPAKQGELARKAYEKVLGDMKDLAEIARESQADAMAKITKRGTEHLDEVKKMMNLK
jgi:phasin family protein